MKYLKLYKKWVTSGKIEDNPKGNRTGFGGLCNTVIGKEEVLNMTDENEELVWSAYWAFSDDEKDYINVDTEGLAYNFTPLRQNLVLLLAAFHNEL